MADMSALVTRLEAVADRLEKVGGGGGDVDNAAFVDGYDEIVNGSLKAFMDKSNACGGEVAAQAAMVAAAFAAQRAFIVTVSTCKKPDAATFQTLLGPTGAKLGEISDFKDANRRSAQFNHLSGVAEGIPALGWVQMEPKPGPYVKDMVGSAQFYTNRVIKEFKESDVAQVEWARAWVQVLNDLADYVKEYHTTGCSWNAKGGDAPKAAPAAAAPAAAPAAAAAPKKEATPVAKTGLFAALNKGGDITSGLKKVDKSQMTHKNPEIRGKAPVVVKASGGKVFGSATAKKYDPVGPDLNGKKWTVEHHVDNKNIVIETQGVNQVLYVYKCTGTTIQVKGKINAITIDGCKKCAIVFDTCVAAFELVNCQSVQVQVSEKVKTISIDKTDGALIYLSKDCMDAEIISAKSSEMNVSLPILEDGQFAEMAIPEQYKTVYDPEAKKLVTLPTDIAG